MLRSTGTVLSVLQDMFHVVELPSHCTPLPSLPWPNHARRTSRSDGRRWRGAELSRSLGQQALRLTGKLTTVQLVRDMATKQAAS